MSFRKTLIVLLAASVSSAAMAVKVVTTTPDLASIASEVVGKNGTVTALIVGARDPHRIEAKPSYMSRVSGADLFLAIGLELEIGYEGPILEGSRNSRVQVGSPGHIYASDWVTVIDKPTGPVSRAQGDIHPYGNPHIWLDPYNGRSIAIKLSTKLSQIDPKNAASYRSNCDNFVARLDAAMFGNALVARFGGPKLWEWQTAGQLVQKAGTPGGWAGQMLPHIGKGVVTYHTSLNYLTRRFGLKVVDELEPKPGLDPTPGHLAKVMRDAKAAGVRAIIQETFYSTKQADLVASRIGAKVVRIPQNVGHEPGATDYISLFDVIVGRLSGAFN